MLNIVYIFWCIAVLAFGATTLYSQSERPVWQKTSSEHAGHLWIDLKCVDSQHCLISAWAGIGIRTYLLLSTDGGASWTSPYTENRNDPNSGRRFPLLLSNIAWPVPELAIVAADSGYILRSLDTGKTWEQVQTYTISDTSTFFTVSSELAQISMYNKKHGILMLPLTSLSRNHFIILSTQDGGVSWRQTETSPVPDAWTYGRIWKAACVDSNRYVCVIDDAPKANPMIAVTSDRGRTWRRMPLPETPLGTLEKFNFQFFDEREGYLAAVDFADDWLSYFARTTDGGETWEMLHHDQIENEFGGLSSISFLDPLEGIAASNGSVVRTDDGGRSWKRDSVEGWQPSTTAGGKIQFLTERRGLLAESNGNLYVWDAGLSGLAERSGTRELDCSVLSSRHTDGLELAVVHPKPDALRMELWDAAGHLILEQQTELLTAGRHVIRFDLPNIPSGIYVVRISSGNLSTSFPLPVY